MLFYPPLLKRYATANNPVITNIASNPETPSSGVGEGDGLGIGVTGAGYSMTNEFTAVSNFAAYSSKNSAAVEQDML